MKTLSEIESKKLIQYTKGISCIYFYVLGSNDYNWFTQISATAFFSLMYSFGELFDAYESIENKFLKDMGVNPMG